MSGTYSKINYNLRVAKSVERKMFLDLLKGLSIFQNLENYQYIGFGSAYFNDFTLYHKHFGIKKMISIEKEIDDIDRFKFNKPFSCIKLHFGESNEVLPILNWKRKSIVWLDYDYALNTSVFQDIQTVIANATSGSLLIITVKAHPDIIETANEKERQDKRLENLEERIGVGKVPYGTTGSNLTLNKLHKLYREIIINEINSCLIKRNGVLSPKKQLNFDQVLNIIYQDGARMLTVGGVIHSNEDNSKFIKNTFKVLPFYSNNESFFSIIPPNLTFKEMKFLDGNLPSNVDIETGSIKRGKIHLIYHRKILQIMQRYTGIFLHSQKL